MILRAHGITRYGVYVDGVAFLIDTIIWTIILDNEKCQTAAVSFVMDHFNSSGCNLRSVANI